MNGALLAAAALAVVLGIAHSYLGERFILVRLFRRADLPKLVGSAELTKQTLRLAWHITTVLAFGLAAILAVLALRSEAAGAWLKPILAASFFGSGLVAAVISRGRHLSWIVFFAIAGLAWWG